MIVFWAMFLVPAALALDGRRYSLVVWIGCSLSLMLLIGFRYEVGGDWYSYLRHYQNADLVPLSQLMRNGDPSYVFLNWLASKFGLGIWFVNLFCAFLFTLGLIRFVRILPEPMLALCVAIPYLVIVFGMGYTRQATAMGLILLGLGYLHNGRRAVYVLLVCFAVTFHKTALVMLPLAAFTVERDRMSTAFWVGITSALFYVSFLYGRIETLYETYVVSDYSRASVGGPVRVALNALPALTFLVLRSRFVISDPQKRLWTWVSLLSLVCLSLVFAFPTAIDRVALYCTFIQLVVWSYFPGLFLSPQRILIRSVVIVLYALVLAVWLNHAVNASSWIPYRFWPLELL